MERLGREYHETLCRTGITIETGRFGPSAFASCSPLPSFDGHSLRLCGMSRRCRFTQMPFFFLFFFFSWRRLHGIYPLTAGRVLFQMGCDRQGVLCFSHREPAETPLHAIGWCPLWTGFPLPLSPPYLRSLVTATVLSGQRDT